MISLNTAFKKVYGEALAPYGFQKIKGRQPYFVKVVNDEVIQVIGIKNEYSMKQGYKRFDIYYGVSTLYRGNMDLTKSILDNSDWIRPLSSIYKMYVGNEIDEFFWGEITSFYYSDDIISLQDKLKESFELFNKDLLPEFNMISNVEECVRYLWIVNPLALQMYDKEWEKNLIRAPYYRDGLVNLLIYNAKEYALVLKEVVNNTLNKLYDDVKKQRIGYSMEEYNNQKKINIDNMEKKLKVFEMIFYDETKRDYVYEILKVRKNINVEHLRKLGIKI